MGHTQRQGRNLLIRIAATALLVATLLVASSATAFAQSAAYDQYSSAAAEQYADGSGQPAPVGPEDPAYPGLADNQNPPQTGPPQAPTSDPDYGASKTVPPDPSETDPSQAPVGPADPAYPGPASQPQETFSQGLTNVLADLGAISQQLAALSFSPSTAATPPTATPLVAMVNPVTTVLDATSVVGGHPPGVAAPMVSTGNIIGGQGDGWTVVDPAVSPSNSVTGVTIGGNTGDPWTTYDSATGLPWEGSPADLATKGPHIVGSPSFANLPLMRAITSGLTSNLPDPGSMTVGGPSCSVLVDDCGDSDGDGAYLTDQNPGIYDNVPTERNADGSSISDDNKFNPYEE